MSTVVLLSQTGTTRKGFNWREWAILSIAGTAAAFSILPTMWTALEQTAARQGMSMPSFLAFQFASSAAQISLIVAIGLFFAHRTGLGAPILERWLKGEAVGSQIRSILLPAISLGALFAVATEAVNLLVFAPLLPGFSSVISELSGWQALLASFYGGIFEELMLRLLLVSALAWLFGKVSHTAVGTPTREAFWVAIGGAAIIFGLGHLPATSLTVATSPLVVLRAIVLNGIMGAIFGAIYWKRGLEAAMLTHFSADIVLHVLFPLMASLLA
jgi:membrane protease YdiL (CAAX protease family)